MKTLGLTIAIGASVGAALSGLNSLSNKTSSIGKLVDKLGEKKVDIVANDKNVLKLSKELDNIGVRVDYLTHKKKELKLGIDKTKEHELMSAIRSIEHSIDKLKDKEYVTKLKIKATTDEKELKKLNRSLDSTRKKMLKLSKEKLGLKEEFSKTKEGNQKVNSEIKETQKQIEILNSEKLEIKEELKKVSSEAEKTSSKIGKINRVIDSINKSKIKIEAIVANQNEFKSKIMETVALASSVVIPLRTAISFESSLADVKKVTDFDETGLKIFGNKIIDLTNNKIPMAREELAAISAEMAQLGIKDKNLIDYTTLTAKMSVAWDMEASDTGEAVGKMKNIFKLNLAGVKKIGDAINHLSNNTSAKASEMIVAMKKVGGIANSFGLSAIKTTALVDTFIALGEEPENAATGINTLLGNLNNISGGSKKAIKAFNRLGLSTRKFKQEIKQNASGALMHFLERLKSLPKMDQSAITLDIFGKDHAPKILKLVDSLGEYKKALALIDVDSKAFKIGILSESLVRLSLAPEKSKKAIKELAASFDELDFNNDNIWRVFDELKIDDKKFKIKLDKDESGAIDEFLSSIKKLDKTHQLKVTTQLFGAKKAKEVLAQLEDVKEYKLQVKVSTKGMQETIKKLSSLNFGSKKIESLFNKLGISSKRFGVDIKQNASSAFVKLLKQLKKLDKATQKELLRNLVGAETSTDILKITSNIDGYLSKLKEVNKERDFANSVEREFEARSATTANSIELLSNSLSSVGVNLGTLFLPAINGVGEALRIVSNGIGSFITEFPTLSKYVGGAVGGFVALSVGGAALGFAFSFLKAGILRTTMLFNVFRGGLLLGAGGLSMFGTAMATIGRAMLMNPIGLAVTAIAGGAYLIYRNWEGIGSWFSGLWSGVEESFRGIWQKLQGILSWTPLGILINNWQPISSFFGGIGTAIKNLFDIGWNGLISALSWNPLNMVSQTWHSLVNYFNNFSLKDAGAKIITSVVDGFNSKIEYLKGKVASITQTIREYWPFSPAKRGALRDIHKIKLMETVAQGVNEKPLLKAVNNTTFKVRKQLALAGAGVALSGSLAVASPITNLEQTSRGRLPSHQIFSKHISTESITKESFSTTTNVPATINQTVTLNFSGETHIHNDMDKEQFMQEIEARVKEALHQAQRDQISKRLYD